MEGEIYNQMFQGERKLIREFTICIGTFHGKVKSRLVETDNGDSLVLDEVRSTVEIHGGIL